MNDTSIATITTSHNGQTLELYFSETIAMLSRNGACLIKFKKFPNWTLKFLFEENNAYDPFSSRMENLEHGANYYFNKWNSDTWVENMEPFYLQTQSGVEFFIKVRTSGNISVEFRSVYITIWKSI